jgi:EAL domain-containing protein (putative c-di-GMP-specific phosphodiesterase class I)
VCSEEALCRWIDPDKGLMAPDEFIPVLEESGLLYKLDLCMVDNIIRDIKKKQSKGLRAVPVSVNLSWSDFQACDMVTEISRRTEAAGISNDLINIEITERVLGKDPDYMRRQIDRFHELGFNVWMDDFGSGYSSLDIMQNYDFDLIKFNMQFMREYETSQKSKVVLTELTQLAIKLGIDTLTEGVETIEQVRFLREIGCDKIQGYYYSKPNPVDVVMDSYQRGVSIGLENIDEMDYFDIICKASLRDPSANNIGQSKVYNYFSTVPIGIFEVRKDGYYAIRYNKTCGDFLESRKGSKLEPITKNNTFFKIELDKAFTDMLDTCSVTDDWGYFENIEDGGNVLKAFAKRLAVNPVTGAAAVMVIAMSVVREQQENLFQKAVTKK